MDEVTESMEEVLEKMEGAHVSPEKNLDGKSDHEQLYKSRGNFDNQEERRKEQLENQKNNRKTEVDKVRGILELVDAVEENDIFNRAKEKRVYYRPSIYVAGFTKTVSYNNVLMLSEWMIEKPSDFHENWYVSPCPKGMRMLVVANRGKTKCFTKYGQYKFELLTKLPGGNPYGEPTQNFTCCSVLDCFYQKQNDTLYVIDFLAWNNQPMTDCDTEFRHYWLKSQFADLPELGTVTKHNHKRLVVLPKVLCTPENFNEFMMKFPPFEELSCPILDGLLFYHKKARYTSGQTPLVGWLFPFMVPEVLGADINIHKAYMLDRPDDYIDQPTFIKNFEQKFGKKEFEKKRFSKNQKMDTSDSKTENKTEGVPADSIEMEAEDTIEKADTETEKLEMDSANDNAEEPKNGVHN